MKKLLAITLTMILVYHGNLYAEKVSSVNQDMAKVGEILRDIYPILLDSDEDQLNKEDADEVSSHIDSIIKHINHADTVMQKKTTTFNISFNTLQHHLHSIKVALADQHYSHAKGLLRSVSNVCTDCHIQDKKESQITPSLLWDSYAASQDIADYNYITRNYRKALEMYQDQISDESTNDYTSYKSLQRILIIYLQVYKDVDSAKDYFYGISKNSLLIPSIRMEINDWIKGIDTIIEDKIHKNKNSFSVLQSHMDQYIFDENKSEDDFQFIRDEKFPISIWIRSSIHEYLMTQPKKNEIPILLFWLATIDRDIDFDLYYSLSDLYLKHCIIEFPQHAYAKKCYNLYKDYVTFYSTGSSGTNIPIENKQELDKLKSYLKSE